jgi:hypothetical protein
MLRQGGKTGEVLNPGPPAFELTSTALEGAVKVYTFDDPVIRAFDPTSFFRFIRDAVITLLTEHPNYKFYTVLRCEMLRTDAADGTTEVHGMRFFSGNQEIIMGMKLPDLFDDKVVKGILTNFSEREYEGSGWRLGHIVDYMVKLSRFAALGGSSYIPLPKVLASMKALINPKNADQECFKWAVTRALNPVEKDAERVSKKLRDQSEIYDWSDVSFPASLDDVTTFERTNSVSIKILGWDDDAQEVTYIRFPAEKHNLMITLFLLEDAEGGAHYCIVKNVSRLVSCQVNKHGHQIHLCPWCPFKSGDGDAVLEHAEECDGEAKQEIIFPDEGTFVHFKNPEREVEVPHVIYADFECTLEPMNNKMGKGTVQYQRHKPSGYGIYLVSRVDPSENISVSHTAADDHEDVAGHLQATVEQLTKELYGEGGRYEHPKQMTIGPEESRRYLEATVCYICGEGFGSGDDKGNVKVRDHCHFTGTYRGAAHSNCNLKLKRNRFTPVFFHNLAGYDSHLFIRNLGDSRGNVSCIPQNDEQYISFSKSVVVGTRVLQDGTEKDRTHTLRFTDTAKFMGGSLASHVENLRASGSSFPHVSKYFSEVQRDCLARKGVFPYEWFTDIDKLSEVCLPPQEAFFSSLNGCGISDADYTHAKHVWETFGMTTMREYHNTYMAADVLQLTDVFESFRDMSIRHYQLDPAHYFTAPGMFWDAALKLTGARLELITDPEMFWMVEKGKRGGVSTITKRYAHANNTYMGDAYDPKKDTSFITYLDANNLYGWAMSKPLPVGGFRWLMEDELTARPEDRGLWTSLHPSFLEVDLEYPEELHDHFNDFVPAPDNIVPEGSKTGKLCPNLLPKERYVLHYRNLQQYATLGVVVTKVHRGVSFVEDDFLRRYIDLNTGLRAQSKNDFESSFFKLANNSVFGKTCENILKRVDVRLATTRKQALRQIAKPMFKRFTIFSEHMVGVHLEHAKVKMTKPSYIGVAILDLSKTLMMDFHYGYVRPKWGDRAQLLMTDTDSLVYEIRTGDLFTDIVGDVDRWFDTSNFPKGGHPSGIPVGRNKKVIGFMKSETGAEIITEFVGLRAKLYAIKMADGGTEKKAKGVKKSAVKSCITFEDYVNCFRTLEPKSVTMNVIRSRMHTIHTESVTKVALSGNDDKRVIIPKDPEGRTWAIGHWRNRPQGGFRNGED